MKNILLGDITSYKAIVVAKFLKKNYSGIKIFTFDTNRFTKIILTRYSDEHFVINENDLTGLTEIIEKNNIEHFIPVINNKLAFFWKNKNIFKNSLGYLGDYQSYLILNDKSKLHDLAEKLQIKVPKKYAKVDDAKFPFVMKPTNLSSAKGVIYVKDKLDIPNNYNFDNIIIQQYIKGKGVGFSFYCKNGNIINGYGHKRLAEYPISGGSSTYRGPYQDERMYDISNKIVKSLNYTGFAMFEFKLAANNELYLLEVNPRIWGSINQGMVNGINYFEEILGPMSHQIKKNKKEVYTYLGPLVYASFIKYLFKLNLKPISVFLSKMFNNQPDIRIISDPMGYLSTILRKLTR